MSDEKHTKGKAEETSATQAAAQYASICEMLEASHKAGEDGEAEYEGSMMDADEIRDAIEENALSVEVRSDWHTPGGDSDPGEYCILLCTGGPAVRIIGDLDQYRQPASARIEHQDWFKPWETWHDADEDVLIEYAGFFWFGE